MMSDAFYVLIYHVIGYRRVVVTNNMSRSFPERNADEIRMLSKKYYHHLCDIALEGIKGFTMSENDLLRRFHILNPELADHYFSKGVSAIAVPGHYNNWEWGSMSPGLQLKFPIVGFYKCMSNNHVDVFVKKHRSRFNTRLASIKETSNTFDALYGMPHAYIMASDQSPTNLKECYWFDFLNQDTPWLHGPEKYARKYNLPVIYVDIQKVKRGYYEIKLVLITDNPQSLSDGEITRLYTQHLEKSILQEPAFWLWSHKRWKHKRN